MIFIRFLNEFTSSLKRMKTRTKALHRGPCNLTVHPLKSKKKLCIGPWPEEEEGEAWAGEIPAPRLTGGEGNQG